MTKIEFFSLLHRIPLYYPAGQKFAQNGSISYGFPDIYNFLFSIKNQDGCQKWQKINFSFAQDTLAIPCGSKICLKWLHPLCFKRYFSLFNRTPLYYPVGQNSLEIALSLTVSEYLLFFIFR